MNDAKYIGLDVHQATTSVAVRDVSYSNPSADRRCAKSARRRSQYNSRGFNQDRMIVGQHESSARHRTVQWLCL